MEEDDEYLVVLGKFLECSTELIDPPPSRSRSGSTASTRDPPSSRDKVPRFQIGHLSVFKVAYITRPH